MQASELATLPQPPADHVIAYGEAKQQVAELRLPKGAGSHPVVIVIHGGCWQTPWAMDHVRGLAAALTAEGFATWSLEYRRLGDPGGGWPGTLQDVARGADHLRAVARAHRLDLGRVVALGHSAGGQLALWLAARHQLPRDSSLDRAPLPLRGIVSLAGIPDLRAAAAANVCGDAVTQLLGGAARPRGPRAPVARRSSCCRSACRSGSSAARSTRWCRTTCRARYQSAAARGRRRRHLELVEGVGHFELVDPTSTAWPAVLGAVRALLAP